MKSDKTTTPLRLAQILIVIAFSVFGGGVVVLSQSDALHVRSAPPKPTRLFSPSNARTENGEYIPTKDFISAARCAACHTDTHKEWSQSLHRNSGREPYYKASVNILEQVRGSEFIQHCESCHAPVSVFSGALVSGSRETRRMDDEGITCTVCHSITEANPLGTSSYTIRKPALLIREDGTASGSEATDKDILADVPSHKRAMMRPLLQKPEFCGACHKSNAPPELNNYKFIRGYSTYDEWQQSGASHESILPFYRRDKRADCNTCHMPLMEGRNDLAADKNGQIISHRWLGANTAVASYYGDKEQEKLTEKFLQNKVLSVDIFALRRMASNEVIAPLAQTLIKTESTTGRNSVASNKKQNWVKSAMNSAATTSSSTDLVNQVSLQPGEEVVAEVVVFNRGAAHTFPPELRDLYEPWVEFEVMDETSGKRIFQSGYLEPNGQLDARAHVYKAILLDELGKPLTRHQVWLGTAKAYDAFVPQGRGDLVRYRFRLPPDLSPTAKIKLTAKVNYRRFINEYAEYVSRQVNEKLPNPVVEMASSEAVFSLGEKAAKLSQEEKKVAEKSSRKVVSGNNHQTTSAIKFVIISAHERGGGVSAEPISNVAKTLARRWNDYGISLLGQAQYGDASNAFRRAAEVDPTDSNLLVNAAIAELQTERYGPERTQIAKAEELLIQALSVNSDNPRASYYQAIVKRSDGRVQEAADIFAKLAAANPRDREIQRQLGQTLYRLGKFDESRAAFLAVNQIDPTDSGAYQFLSPLFASAGLVEKSEEAQQKYLLWRDDPSADAVANRFYSMHPEWADARAPGKIYGADSPARPAITGDSAAAER